MDARTGENVPQVPKKKERRRYSRSALSITMPILWEDENGQEGLCAARLIDVSVTGAKLWLPIKVPARALVSFNCQAQGVGGRGTVRYCNAAKGGYVVGLELSNGTGWQDQNLDLRNLAAGIAQANQRAHKEDTAETIVSWEKART
jgi:hypothetical protein